MLLSLARLAKSRIFMDNLRLDVTPDVIFEPSFDEHGNVEDRIAATKGFFFYVDVFDDGPTLMVMKNYGLSSKTVGEVSDVPEDHLNRVVNSKDAKEIAGMYTIDKELEVWISSQLSL